MPEYRLYATKENLLKEALFCAKLSRWVYGDIEAENHLAKLQNLKLGISQKVSSIKVLNEKDNQGVSFFLNDSLYVVFRGTETDEFADIKKDLKFFPKKTTTQKATVRIHEGFSDSFDEIKLTKFYLNLLDEMKVAKRVFVTGHSLGAAIATLLAGELQEEFTDQRISLITFGSPRVGDRRLKRAFKKLPHLRVVNNRDIVTEIPPRWFLYRHQGFSAYFDYAGKLRWIRLPFIQRWKDCIQSRWRAYKKKEPYNSIYDHRIGEYISKLMENHLKKESRYVD